MLAYISHTTTAEGDDVDIKEFIKTIKTRSNYNYGIEVNSDDKILTLSSCIGTGEKRVVLHSKLIEFKEYNNEEEKNNIKKDL